MYTWTLSSASIHIWKQSYWLWFPSANQKLQQSPTERHSLDSPRLWGLKRRVHSIFSTEENSLSLHVHPTLSISGMIIEFTGEVRSPRITGRGQQRCSQWSFWWSGDHRSRAQMTRKKQKSRLTEEPWHYLERASWIGQGADVLIQWQVA